MRFIASQVCLLGLFSSSIVQANDNLDYLFSLSLEELLNVPISGATRNNQTPLTVPASVTVYTQAQIRDLGIEDLTALMNYVPGFQSQRIDISSVTNAFSSRGYSSSDTGLDVLILLDGQRLNSDWTGGLYLHHGLISLDKIERVEFIRGPGSAIYGSNAYLGVVNIISQSENELRVAIGDQGKGQVSLQHRHEPTFGQFEVFVNGIRDDGQALQVYDPLLDTISNSRDGYDFKEIYLKSKFNDFSASLYYSVTETERFYVSGLVADKVNQLDTQITYITLQHHQNLSSDFTLNSRAFFGQRRFEITSIVQQTPAVIGAYGPLEEVEPQIELTLNYQGDSQNKGLIGIEWRRPKITESDADFFGDLQFSISQAPKTARTIKGVFAQYQGQILEQIDYVLGVRVDDYSNFGSNLSPRAGIVWQYDETKTFKTLYGESFRAPSRSQTDVQNNPVIIANPDLEPEVAKTFELIGIYSLRETYFATTLYHIDLSDVITDTATTPIQRFNTGNESLSGIEMEWHERWSERVQSRINFSWTFNGPNKINTEAEVFSAASLIYSTANWSSALLFNHHSSKEDENSSSEQIRKVPARAFVAVNVRYYPAASLEYFVKVNNLFDEDYNSVATSGAGNTLGVENRGANILTGVRFNF